MRNSHNQEILYEDLCFDCQQAVEKALKSLLVHLGVVVERTHSIAVLLTLIEKKGVDIPKEVKLSMILTEYAVEMRYPGAYEPVTKKEFEEALKIAEKVIRWVGKLSELEKENAK